MLHLIDICCIHYILGTAIQFGVTEQLIPIFFQPGRQPCPISLKSLNKGIPVFFWIRYDFCPTDIIRRSANQKDMLKAVFIG